MGVLGRGVKVIDLETLAFTALGTNPVGVLEEAIQLAYGTSVVLLTDP